jgi:hypothetical protein
VTSSATGEALPTLRRAARHYTGLDLELETAVFIFMSQQVEIGVR